MMLRLCARSNLKAISLWQHVLKPGGGVERFRHGPRKSQAANPIARPKNLAHLTAA